MSSVNRDYTVYKNCSCCGNEFHKLKRDSWQQWDERKFCSRKCASKATKSKTPPELRFWKHVKIVKNGCWEWRAAKDQRGYGRINAGRGLSPIKAHRISWEIHYGFIPKGLAVLHACDNPGCVNPDHLMVGSLRANSIDASKKGRLNKISLLNLCPGEKGKYGAGSKSNLELSNVIT